MSGRSDRNSDRNGRAEKRARILRAALDVCERRGVDGARMEEVAALAKVSKGTLYAFFESKQDLLLATMIDSYEESLRILGPEVDSEPDPRARLDLILEGMAKVLAAVTPQMNVHYQAWGLVAADPSQKLRLYGFLDEFFSARSATIERAIRDGQRAGVFRSGVDVPAVADGLMALLGGFLYRSTFDPARASPERLRATFEALVRTALHPDADRPDAGGRGG